MRKSILRWLGVAVLLLAACGPSATATPTIPPTATPRAGVTPTAAVAPTPGVAPTATPVAKPTPAPTVTAGPKRGGTIRYQVREEPPSWDPASTHVDPADLSKYVGFARLLVNWSAPPKNCQSQVMPWAAQSWKFIDDKTAEFTLKEGIRFQNRAPVNGREATAADFVASFEHYRKLPLTSAQSSQVESVTAKDKYTFQMKTKTPWGGLITELMANPRDAVWLEPAEVAAPGYSWTDPVKSWVGSGPFMFKAWQPGVKWSFERHPNYFVPGQPLVDGIDYVIISEGSTQLAALIAGQLNMVRDLDENLVDQATRSIPGVQMVRCPGVAGSPAALWMDTSNPPFNDIRVRRAVSMAINRKGIMDTLLNGRGALAGVLPVATAYGMAIEEYPADVRSYLEFHADQSKKLLAEAGFPNGFETVVNFTPRYEPPAPMIAEAVVSMLNDVGIKAKLNMMEYTQFQRTVLQAKYPAGQMALSNLSNGTPEAPLALTSFWSKAGASNRSLVVDPDYDKLFEEFRAAGDEAKRTDLARRMQVLVAEKAYRVHLPLAESTMLARPGVHFTWVGRDSFEYNEMMGSVWIE